MEYCRNLRKRPGASASSAYKNLTQAIKNGDLEAVREFLHSGSSPTMPNCNGWTAIHQASYHGFADILKLLFTHETEDSNNDDDITDDKKHLANLLTHMNQTPLMLCAISPKFDIEVLRVLVDAGADINATTLTGYTALMYACENGANIDLVKFIVENGADVNQKDDIDHFIPLQHAIYGKHMAIIEYLVPISKLTHRHMGGDDALDCALSVYPESARLIMSQMSHLQQSHFVAATKAEQWDIVCDILRRGFEPPDKTFCERGGTVLALHKVAISQPEKFKQVLEAHDIKDLLRFRKNGGVPLEIFIAMNVEECKQPFLLETLLKHRAIPGNEDDFLLPEFAPELRILYRYFSKSKNPYQASTLKLLCRQYVRGFFRSNAANDWEAYCRLVNSGLPNSIKSFLLYELDT